MRKNILISSIIAVLLILSSLPAFALEPNGKIFGTDVEYSDFAVTKDGIRIRLTNTYNYNVKISMRVDFYDRSGNSLGYSLFGLREIPAEAYVDISANHLNGNWRKCRDAERITWQKMTYEILY